ncbi:MAG: ATP-binding protein [Ferruginibacter sp.]
MKIGFVQALENELNRLAKTGRYQIKFNKSGSEYRLSPEKSIILFRLCQEVLNNILKHSKAKTITTTLNFSDSFFELIISDDGVGFVLEPGSEESIQTESTGLLNIRKRAKLIDANIHIDSIPGTGTEVKITVPRKS